MFENIGSFLKKIMKNEQKELLVDSTSSKDAAKERLHIVLMQDRANVSADFLDLMKEEIVDVIKKYIVVDETQIDVRLTNQENEDGTMGAPSLHANIPILNIRNDIKCEILKENEKVPIIENVDDDRTQIIQIVREEDLEKNTNIDAKDEIEENSLVNNENSENVLVENNDDKIDEIENQDNIEISENNEESNIENNEIENNIQIEENKEIIQEESIENNNDNNDNIEEIQQDNNETDEDKLENEIDELDDDDDDDDVTFDDLLKAAEEEERLQKLENAERENVEENKEEIKTEIKRTEKPKRKIKSRTSKAKKNRK